MNYMNEGAAIDPQTVSYIVNAIILLVVIGAPILNFIAMRQVRRDRIQGVELFLWLALIIVVPIIGSVIWLIVANRRQTSHT